LKFFNGQLPSITSNRQRVADQCVANLAVAAVENRLAAAADAEKNGIAEEHTAEAVGAIDDIPIAGDIGVVALAALHIVGAGQAGEFVAACPAVEPVIVAATLNNITIA
jgi:hypothetical protein